jgi:hypothetical protein
MPSFGKNNAIHAEVKKLKETDSLISIKHKFIIMSNYKSKLPNKVHVLDLYMHD